MAAKVLPIAVLFGWYSLEPVAIFPTSVGGAVVVLGVVVAGASGVVPWLLASWSAPVGGVCLGVAEIAREGVIDGGLREARLTCNLLSSPINSSMLATVRLVWHGRGRFGGDAAAAMGRVVVL